MSALNDNNNLPGSIIDIENEISQDYDPSAWGSTESVLVIGTAFQGPVGVPTKVYNSDMARYYFGASYDNATHRSASLVPGVQAAYEAGCRTIYAMRVGGKDIYKDFRLCEGKNTYRLRVSGQTPTNITKQCYFRVNVDSGYESITLYKPASKATIQESKQGYVDSSNSIIEIEMRLNEDNGYTRNDKLTDLVTFFNTNTRNNVLVMSIVDKDGNDVTNDPATQDLCIGSLFNGIYFVGRDKNADGISPYSVVSASAIVNESSPKPYSSYNGAFYRVLEFNSDISSEYPIYARNYDELKALVRGASVTAGEDYEFLRTAGIVDRLWKKDDTDYEEVELTNYQIYEKLGSGFAITAKAVKREGVDSRGNERKPRVIETPSDDENHIVGLNEGIYALLENTEVDYRVLVAANADDKITAKLPKADDFRTSSANSIKLLGNASTGAGALIEATTRVDPNDLTAAKSYTFHFAKVAEDEVEYDNITDVYVDHVAQIVARVNGGADAVKAMVKANAYPDGTSFLVFDDEHATSGVLYRIVNGKLAKMNIARLANELISSDLQLYVGKYDKATNSLTYEAAEAVVTAGSPTTYLNKEYILVDNGSAIFVADVCESAANAGKVALKPLGDLDAMMGDSDNDSKTLIYVEDSYGQNNRVNITTGAADFIPLSEFVDILNDDATLGRLFTFSLTQDGADQKEDYPESIEDEYVLSSGDTYYFQQTRKDAGTHQETDYPGAYYKMDADREVSYNYSMYIPYRTNDNFVRQLAQHCAYSSLRTSMTHGIIGYSPLHTFTLKAMQQRVDELLAADFSLYAKKPNGRMILNSTKDPVEIGGNVSVTAFQHAIVDTVNSVTTTCNGAAYYAGIISTLPVEKSTTMQTTGLSAVDFTFSNSQLRNLCNAGYVCTKDSVNKGICIVDGVTKAPASELRSRLSIVRTLNECGKIIREASEPFIGLKNSVNNRNSLKTAIDSALTELKDKLIQDYQFTIINLATYTTDTEIKINYTILPLNEIRTITNNITVTRQALS